MNYIFDVIYLGKNLWLIYIVNLFMLFIQIIDVNLSFILENIIFCY